MAGHGHYGQRTTPGTMFCVFLSCLACLYVGGRLWTQSRELQSLASTSANLYVNPHRKALENTFISNPTFMINPADKELLRSDELVVNSRATSGPVQALNGQSLTAGLPTQNPDANLIGQFESLEAGILKGWACVKGQKSANLQVQIYVDEKLAGEVAAIQGVQHHIVERLCGLDSSDSPQIGFEFKLPDLIEGRHEVRGFVKTSDGTAKQEINQSPLPFMETRESSGSKEIVRRKDSIIRVRNAQIAALWSELHIKQPWRNALNTESRIGLPDDSSANETRALAVIAINSGIGVPDRRASLRNTWVKTGEERKKLEEQGIHIRFVIGYSDSPDHPDEETIKQENKKYGDILRIDTLDTYEALSAKTIKMFTILPDLIKADFYFKVDDDVAVNTDALITYLKGKRGQGNLYTGCMKSGQVLTDQKYKWYEPESWRFGDPSGDGYINYPRHASGQIYGVSSSVARYIGHNAAILHKYANEDVSVGSWLVGLDVLHDDERRFCCESDAACRTQESDDTLCISYYERQCAGICHSEQRLEGIWKSCLDDPLHKRKSRNTEE